MSFSFGNSGGAASGNAPGNGEISEGQELELIQTEALGFKSIASDAKVRLTSAWDQSPSQTASLLTIAPRIGVLAAAGPDGIAIARTDVVRKAFDEGEIEDDTDIRAFEPQAKLPLSMRVSHIAFTADESYLVLSAENGGGLAVYDTQKLLQGVTQSSFELGTNGESLRALVPNPTPEKAELCALVTNNGNLYMANLKERQVSSALKSQVSCLSWSSKGKQLAAGLADGTLYQMTPEGEGKGEVPCPPSISDSHVNTLFWLENNLFLAIHTTTNASPPSSVYHLIHRSAPNFTFQKMTDPVEPFGADKAPHYSLARLRDFPPNLQDLLIVCSTESSDVGLLSRSKTPLTTERPADAVTNVFTTTELLDDSKRAQLPMGQAGETLPIGAALDLSSRDRVFKPLPADEEIEESPGPVPGYWILNNEGVLSAWWVIYEESIRQGTTYPGIATSDMQAAPVATDPSPAPTSAFGSAPTFGGASALGGKASPWATAQSPGASNNKSQTASAFGGGSTFGSAAASSTPAFGQASAFGQSAQMGANKSPWAAAGAASPGSNAPAFGQTSAFGQSAQMGASKSPWAAGGAASAGSNAPTFGQTGFASMGSQNKSPFASASPAAASGGFASFAGSGGFSSATANSNSGGSIFGKPATGSPFSSNSKAADTAFPAPKSNTAGGSVFGSGGAFKLESSFKADPANKDDEDKPTTGDGGSKMFGGGFSSALGDAAKQEPAKDLDMRAGDDSSTAPSDNKPSNLGIQEAKSPFSSGESHKTNTKSPFASTAQTTSDGPSPFGNTTGQTSVPNKSPFASTGDSKSSFDLQSSATPAKSPFATALSSTTLFGSQPSQATPARSPFSIPKTEGSQNSEAKNPFSLGSGNTQNTSPLFGHASKQESRPKSPLGFGALESTTPTTTPAPNRFSFATDNESSTPKGGLFSQAPKTNLFTTPGPSRPTPEIKLEEEEEAPLPPDTTSRNTYPLGDSSASSAATDASKKVAQPESAPLPPDFVSTPKPASTNAAESAPLPPDFTTTPKTVKPDGQASSSGFVFKYEPVEDSSEDSDDATLEEAAKEPKRQPKKSILGKKPLPSKSQPSKASRAPALPESSNDSEEDEDEERSQEEDEDSDYEEGELQDDTVSEGSGVMVGKDTSPSISGLTATPGFTAQSPFGSQPANNGTPSQTPLEKPRSSLFGEMSRNAPVFPRPNATSPRSPSPVRSAIPHRMSQLNTSRSVSAPGMASQILGASKRQSVNMTAVPSRAEEDPQLRAQRLARSRREAEETKVLEDDDDDEIHKILRSEIEPSLKMDDFIAHVNVAPSSQETIPSQVEAVYRDINSMIDTLGLNARSLSSFIKGHLQSYQDGGRNKDDLENEDDWVLCEVNDLGEVIDNELARDLAKGRVHNVEGKSDTCQDLAREMSRLRSKQEDLKKLITVRLDPDQADISRSLPLSTEQAAQQNELRREYARFSKLLADAEEALTLLKTRLAALDTSSGKNNGNVPTVDAVLRTITKMTSMVEKRSGDVDVLENQMRKLRFSTVNSREGSPAVTPQRQSRSVMFSPEHISSPRNLRSSFMSPSVAGGANTTPRKKLSGFSVEEKKELTTKRAKRRAILDKLKVNVQKNGVQPWPMPEDTD